MKIKYVTFMVAGFILGSQFIASITAANANDDAPESQAAVAQYAASATLTLEDCHVKHIAALAKCAMFDVPENWQDPAGKKIGLHVAVIPPSGGQAVKTPLYVLAGGPGQSASSLGRHVDIPLQSAREGREVILVDQRGTGKSAPFDCELNDENKYDTALFVKQCLAHTDNRPQFYTSAEFMQDLDAVRRALGHDKIALWGGSYGTRAALLYVRAYPDNVEAMVLDAVAAPVTPFMQLGLKSASRSLELLFTRCAAEVDCNAAFPNLRANIDAIKEQLTNSPMNLGVGFEKVGASEFMNTLRSALYSSRNTALIPYVVQQFTQGNTAPWKALSESGGAIVNDISFGTMLSVLCAEEMPRTSASRLQEEAANSVFADVTLELFFEACPIWPAASYPQNYEAVVSSDIPTLVFSGELDPVTPPSFGEIAMQGLSNARHVIARHTGHIAMSTACAPDLIAEFLDGKDPQALDITCMDTTRPTPFVLGLSGPKP